MKKDEALPFKLNKAVLLVTFNRLDYLQNVFAAVAKVKPPKLYLASDGARMHVPGEKEKIEHIRQWMLAQVDWPCEVKTRFLERNSGGCGPGVSEAVSWLFSNERDGIIIEDDCVPSPSFFRYCQECLDRYVDDKRVWHISGTAPFSVDLEETYWFSRTMLCWGWASWANRWNNHFSLSIRHLSRKDAANMSDDYLIRQWWRSRSRMLANHEIDTWDYMWSIVVSRHAGLCITPAQNLISNIGDEGVHFRKDLGGVTHHASVELGAITHPPHVELNKELSYRLSAEVLRGHSRLFLYVKFFCENELPLGLSRFLSRIWCCFYNK